MVDGQQQSFIGYMCLRLARYWPFSLKIYRVSCIYTQALADHRFSYQSNIILLVAVRRSSILIKVNKELFNNLHVWKGSIAYSKTSY